MKFVGRRGPLASLLLKNLLLTTVTIGFYRFWAKTRARRFLWSYTRILGEPLEYLGTGRELFIGFLIVVAILVPLAAIWSVITDFNIALSSSVFQPVALNAVYYLAVFLLIQVAVYRMWRYRLTRTVWRGVRFGLDGSSVQYAVRVFPWAMLSVGTLGFAFPWYRICKLRFLVGNARLGSTNLQFRGSARRLFSRWMIVFLPFGAGVALLVFESVTQFRSIARMMQSDSAEFEPELFLNMPGFLLGAALMASAPVLKIWYDAAEFRYAASVTRMGHTTFRSNLRTGFVYRVYGLFWVLFLLALVVLTSAVGIVALVAADRMDVPSQGASGIAVLAGGAVLIVGAATFGIARILIVDISLFKEVCRSTEVRGAEFMDELVQSPGEIPRFGEGLADSLDIG